MKYLVLAYGAEKDWNALTDGEQHMLLAQDEVLRNRGDVVAALKPAVTTVRAWDGTPAITDGAFANSSAPLAGFGIIEAADLDEAIALVAQTPCARAREALELAGEVQAQVSIAFTIQHLAAIAVLQPRGIDAERAARLLGYVDAQLDRLGATREYTEEQERNRIDAAIRSTTPESRLAILIAEGREWPEDRAVTEALLV